MTVIELELWLYVRAVTEKLIMSLHPILQAFFQQLLRKHTKQMWQSLGESIFPNGQKLEINAGKRQKIAVTRGLCKEP